MITNQRLRNAILILSSAASLSAYADVTTSAELRVFGIETVAGGSSYSYLSRDFFNNGNPLSGLVYTDKAPSQATITGGYTSSGVFSAGSELSGPAPGLIGTANGIGIGGLNFKLPDASNSTNNLTPGGYTSKTLDLSVKFLDPRPTGTPPVVGAQFEGLLQKTSGWDVFSVWDLISPSSGASYGIRVNGGGVSNTSIFNDQLDLRVVTSLQGVTTVNLERVTRDSANVLFRTVLGSVPFSAAYGGSLFGVDEIVLDLNRDIPGVGGNTAVHAGFRFLDLSMDGNGDTIITQLGGYSFADQFIYTDQNFAQASARASWLIPDAVTTSVPEPTTIALAGLALAGLAVARRRRMSYTPTKLRGLVLPPVAAPNCFLL